LLLLAAVAWIAASSLASASTPSLSTARLVLRHQDPATVSGTGFKPRTRIRVTFVGTETFVHRPVTNSQGAFTTTFQTAVDRCTAWSVTANQPGRAAVVLRGPKPECAPASTP
jgi:hypothetical protein